MPADARGYRRPEPTARAQMGWAWSSCTESLALEGWSATAWVSGQAMTESGRAPRLAIELESAGESAAASSKTARAHCNAGRVRTDTHGPIGPTAVGGMNACPSLGVHLIDDKGGYPALLARRGLDGGRTMNRRSGALAAGIMVSVLGVVTAYAATQPGGADLRNDPIPPVIDLPIEQLPACTSELRAARTLCRTEAPSAEEIARVASTIVPPLAHLPLCPDRPDTQSAPRPRSRPPCLTVERSIAGRSGG